MNAPLLCKRVSQASAMRADEYRRNPALGSSDLKQLLRSPAHFLQNRAHPPPPTPAMALGSAIHEAILEPDLFFENMVLMPSFQGLRAKQRKEEWEVENYGKTILSTEELATIESVLTVVRQHPLLSRLLSAGKAEQSYFWRDPDSGVRCKCRPDFLREGHIILDIKTTGDASPHSFRGTVARFNYHMQAAWYTDGVSQVTGEIYDQFVIVALEKTPPYGIAVYVLDDASIELGRKLCRKALNTYQKCTQNKQWPAYSLEPQLLNLPAWAFYVEDV